MKSSTTSAQSTQLLPPPPSLVTQPSRHAEGPSLTVPQQPLIPNKELPSPTPTLPPPPPPAEDANQEILGDTTMQESSHDVQMAKPRLSCFFVASTERQAESIQPNTTKYIQMSRKQWVVLKPPIHGGKGNILRSTSASLLRKFMEMLMLRASSSLK